MSQKNKLTWLQKIVIKKLASTRIGRKLIFEQMHECIREEFYEDNNFSNLQSLTIELVETSLLNTPKYIDTISKILANVPHEIEVLIAFDKNRKRIYHDDFVFIPNGKTMLKVRVSYIGDKKVFYYSDSDNRLTSIESEECILCEDSGNS